MGLDVDLTSSLHPAFFIYIDSLPKLTRAPDNLQLPSPGRRSDPDAKRCLAVAAPASRPGRLSRLSHHTTGFPMQLLVPRLPEPNPFSAPRFVQLAFTTLPQRARLHSTMKHKVTMGEEGGWGHTKGKQRRKARSLPSRYRSNQQQIITITTPSVPPPGKSSRRRPDALLSSSVLPLWWRRTT